MKLITSAAVLAAFACVAGSAGAAMPMAGPADKAFVKGATQSNLAEIAAGKLAEMKAPSPTVKLLGKRFIDDHTKANAVLASIVHAQGMTMPTMPNAMQRATAAALKKLAGSQFDTMWLKTQETGHEQTVAIFKQEIASGTDPQLVAYAKSNIQVVEEHLTKLTSAATTPGRDAMPAHNPMMNGSNGSMNGGTGSGEMNAASPAPDAMASPATMSSPGAMMSPGAMTSPGMMASPGAMASPKSMASPM